MAVAAVAVVVLHTTSSTEAELLAMSQTAKEAI